jgi:teichuronic acid biosynthesis glycosyltransferase TuaG
MNLSETQQILVSIITPVYNSENFLSATIESVIRQTYLNWELILVDDCSTDRSFEIISEYARKDLRIKSFRNNINSKAFESRNVALKNANGRYIAFLDSDDIWAETKLEYQIKFMQKNEYGFTYTNFYRFIDNPIIGKPINLKKRISYYGLIQNTIIATSSVIIDKKMTGDFRMENLYYDDFKLWLTLLKKINFAYCLNKNLLYYRITPNSLSNNKFKSAKKVYKMFNENLDLNFLQSKIYFFNWIINTIIKYLLKY